MEFYKYEATGNDFILIDFIKEEKPLTEEFVKGACSRRFGIGADGILVALPSKDSDVKMRIFNSDGSEAEMCGNGARALALYMHDSYNMPSDVVTIETQAGIRRAKLSREDDKTVITIEMGTAGIKRGDIPMEGNPEDEAVDVGIELQGGKTILGTCISMGNPHCVIFVDHVNDYPVEITGPEIENHPLFLNKTNVEFVEPVSPDQLLFRVWERGVGETLACGTGTCASAVAGHRKGLVRSVVTVSTRGGDLEVDCSSNEIFLTGQARRVYKGVIEE